MTAFFNRLVKPLRPIIVGGVAMLAGAAVAAIQARLRRKDDATAAAVSRCLEKSQSQWMG